MSGKTLDEKAIFTVACSIESSEARNEYLNQVCGDNRGLLERVVVLLRMRDEEPEFLESQVVAASATIDLPTLSEQSGDSIGPYKLREQIGEGGMGVVYVAEQLQPVTRKVALKIIKPGMDTKQVIARFEAERQALAMMDHPNIAKVLDAGSTESGRPYFVMDLVRGLPFTEYCDKQKLGTSTRLELFITVCHAVQHAHQKGIIHRDIKPGNILATRNGDRAVPKVIDFGVAKATSQRLTEHTIYTQFSQMIGTPLYMSPEQAEMSELDVDTRSDVYSLGVVLYELLTGSTPVEKEKLSSASFDEIRRIIREDEPLKPSDRISTLKAQAISTITTQRNCEPRQLNHILRGELDWIVMKALDKDRTRRYESASAFAADIQRYLDNEPVAAGPPSVVYRFRKFARRNAAVMITAGLVLLALLLGIAGTSWQAWRATGERDEKQAALAKADANWQMARQAVDDMYSRVAVEWLADQPHLTKLQQELLLKAAEFYEQMPTTAGADPAVARQSANAKLRAGRVLRALYEHRRAEPPLRESLGIFEALHENNPKDCDDALATATAAHELGQVLLALGKAPEAERLYRRALSVCQAIATDDARRKEVGTELVAIHHSLASAGPIPRPPAASADPVSEPTRHASEAVRLSEMLVEEFPDDPKCQLQLANSLRHLAASTRDHSEKERLLQRGIQITERLADDYPMLPSARNVLAGCKLRLAQSLRDRDRVDESMEISREALREFERLMMAYPDILAYRLNLAWQHAELAFSLVDAGRTDEAEEEAEKALSLCTDLPAGLPRESFRGNLGNICAVLGGFRFEQRDFLGAIRYMDKFIAIDPTTATAHVNRSLAHQKLGDTTRALADVKTAVRLAPSSMKVHNQLGAIHCIRREYEAADQAFTKVIELEPNDAMGYGNRGSNRCLMGRYDEALADLTQALKLAPTEPNFNLGMASLLVTGPAEMRDPQKAVTMVENDLVLKHERQVILGYAWYRLGQFQQAKEALTEAAELPDRSHPRQLAARLYFLAMACHQLGEQEAASKWFHQAETWTEQNAGPEDVHLQRIREEAAALLKEIDAKGAVGEDIGPNEQEPASNERE